MNEIQLDHERVKELILATGQPIAAHLRQAPHDRIQIYEVLNALAIQVALVLAGTGPDDAAVHFFMQTLQDQVNLAARPHESSLN